ncbi:MAG: hypothetical protein LUE64_00070, partial [Candidatus Gastranaerophilales bacterium]|nr:hypothetical protein [Candidatus Gastranaerophilales bacterium]
TASCVSAVMDINNNGKPNTLGKDVTLFNANSLGGDCYGSLLTLSDGSCWSTAVGPSTYGYLTYDECMEKKDELGLSYCFDYKTYGYGKIDKDYYAGAVNYCGAESKLPTLTQLALIASEKIYEDSSIKYTGSKTNVHYSRKCTEETLISYGLSGYSSVWSSDRSSTALGYYWNYGSTLTTWSSTWRYGSFVYVICRLN